MLNELIPTALFSTRMANEQHIRACRESSGPRPQGDIRDYSQNNVAERFRDIDPDGSKAMELLRSLGE